MSRPIDPRTAYRVVPHTTHGHTYASVQRTVVGEDGRNRRRHWHLGVLEGNRFTPWAEFLTLPDRERKRYVFPPEWDLSLLDQLTNRRGQGGGPRPQGEPRNRLYGDVWLLERIAEATGVRHDLEAVFEGDGEMVDAVLTLAMFPCLTGSGVGRVGRWQRIAKSPCGFPLTPRAMATLTQSITERHRRRFLSLRAAGLKSGELCAVDSVPLGVCGDPPDGIRRERSRGHLPPEQEPSVVVHPLSGHLPVYLRAFPEDLPDARTLDIVLNDLDGAGFRDTALVLGRGSDPRRDLETCIRRGQAALMSVEVGQAFVVDRIRRFGAYGSCPDAMSVDGETGLAWFQCGLDRAFEATDGGAMEADRLKLDLYLDIGRRAEILARLESEIESQREELAAMLGKTPLPGGGADGSNGGGDPRPKRSYGHYEVACDPDTGIVRSFELAGGRVARTRLLAGYSAIVAHRLDLGPMEAHRILQGHDEQGKRFRQLNDLTVADWLPRRRSEEGWPGRELILLVGLVLSSQAWHVWRTVLRGRFASWREMFDEMRDIRCIEPPGHPGEITPFGETQLEICQAFGFEPPEGCPREPVSLQAPTRRRGRPRRSPAASDDDPKGD